MTLGPFSMRVPPSSSPWLVMDESPYHKFFAECIKYLRQMCPSGCFISVKSNGDIAIQERTILKYEGPIEECQLQIGAIKFKLSTRQIDKLIVLRVMDS